MAGNQIADWTVLVEWDTKGFDKAAKHVEKTLAKTLNTQGRVTKQQQAAIRSVAKQQATTSKDIANQQAATTQKLEKQTQSAARKSDSQKELSAKKVSKTQEEARKKAATALAKENQLKAQQNIFREKAAKAQKLGIETPRISRSKDPQRLRKQTLELNDKIFRQGEKLKKQAARKADIESKAAQAARDQAAMAKEAATAEKKVKKPAAQIRGETSSILGGERLSRKRFDLEERIAVAQRESLRILGRQSDKYRQLEAAAAELNKRIGSTVGTERLHRLTQSVKRFTTESRSATAAIRRQTAALRLQDVVSKSLSDSTRNLARQYLSVFAVVAGARSIIGIATRFDNLNASMLAASGSAEQAVEDFQFLTEASNRLGIDIEVMTDGFRKFGAASRGAGLSGEETKVIFEDIASAAKGFGLEADRTNLVFLAMSQILSKGTVSMEELKRQLGEQLPTALQDAAKSMNLTSGAFIELVESGNLVSKDFLPAFAAQLKKTVVETGALAAGIDSITSAQERFTNSFKAAISGISQESGKAAILSVFKSMESIVKSLTPLIEALLKTIGGIAVAVGAFLTGFMAVAQPLFVFINLIVDLISILTGGDGLVTALEAVGAAMGTVFVFSAISAIPAMIGGIGTLLVLAGKVLTFMKLVNLQMVRAAVLATIISGGANLIAAGTVLAGAGAIAAVGFGAHKLLTRGEQEEADQRAAGPNNTTSDNSVSTINNYNELNVITPSDEVKDVVQGLFDDTINFSGVTGG